MKCCEKQVWGTRIVTMSVSIIFKSRISTPYTARTHSYTVNIQAASIYLVYVNWYKCQSYLNLPPPSPPPSSSHILANLTSKQKVLLITPNHWKLLSCRPPGESSCLAVALIHVAYANVHPFERFSRNMMLFRLPIIVYIITPLHDLVEFW